MSRYIACGSFAAFFVALMVVSARGDDLIDTTPSWNGTTNVFYFGINNTETYGQTITVPTDGNDVLKSFTFYVNGPSNLTFQGEVYAWNGTEASGSQLYQSAPVTTNGLGAFQTETFTPGITLTGGDQYVLFGTTDNQDQSVANATATWGTPAADVYSGGLFVFLNDGGDSSQWTTVPWTQNWSGVGEGGDLAFKADFGTCVPEPGSISLLGLSLLGLVSRRSRREPVRPK